MTLIATGQCKGYHQLSYLNSSVPICVHCVIPFAHRQRGFNRLVGTIVQWKGGGVDVLVEQPVYSSVIEGAFFKTGTQQ